MTAQEWVQATVGAIVGLVLLLAIIGIGAMVTP